MILAAPRHPPDLFGNRGALRPLFEARHASATPPALYPRRRRGRLRRAGKGERRLAGWRDHRHDRDGLHRSPGRHLARAAPPASRGRLAPARGGEFPHRLVHSRIRSLRGPRLRLREEREEEIAPRIGPPHRRRSATASSTFVVPGSRTREASAPAAWYVAVRTSGSSPSPRMRSSPGADSAAKAPHPPYLTPPGRRRASFGSVISLKSKAGRSARVRSMRGPARALASIVQSPASPTPARCTVCPPGTAAA